MQIEKNYSLKELNTFGMQVKAEHFTTINSAEELKEIISYAKTNNWPFLVLGGGSNILFTTNFNGIVIKNNITGIETIKESTDFVWIKVGAGVVWHHLVIFCIEKGWGGLENLSLIPGTVGASPIQNIGAYGVEVKDSIETVEAIEVATGKTVAYANEACCFGYRDSIFKKELKNKVIITHVIFKLHKKPVFHVQYGAIQQTLKEMGITQPNIKAISDAVIAIRSSKLPDPAKIGNAGSFFKNPVITIEAYKQLQINYPTAPMFPVNTNYCKIPAAWLIEQAGFKGFRKGDAGCNPLQPLVLVNYGNAKGSDIVALAETIINTVFTKFHISLEPEVNIL
ncbi:MAG: UDP-N-acetylmuramate dehydrogenase [Chitinophagaceae bacterium]